METIDEISAVVNCDGDKIMNPILVYYYIWSCICCTMHKQKDLKYGFDCKIGFELSILSQDNIFITHSNKI